MREVKPKFWECIKRLGAIIGLIGGTLGLIVTFNTISTKICVEPKMKSKLVSFSSSIGTFSSHSYISEKTDTFQTAQFMVKVAINVTGEDINYYDLIPYVKFDKEFVKGEIYYPKNSYTWSFHGEDYYLQLPKDKLFYYNTILNTGKTNVGYITFFVRYDKGIHYSKEKPIIPKSVNLDFVSSENESKIYTTGELNIDIKDEWKFAFEEDIWVKKE